MKGEAALDRIAAGPPNVPNNGVQFSRMRAGFTRAPGRMTIREGLVSGPMVGASIDGLMDYANNDLRLRGTFVPLHELNSAFGEIPIVGFFLGGKEGLIGSMTYEVVGSPGAPVFARQPDLDGGARLRAQVPGIPEQPAGRPLRRAVAELAELRASGFRP